MGAVCSAKEIHSLPASLTFRRGSGGTARQTNENLQDTQGVADSRGARSILPDKRPVCRRLPFARERVLFGESDVADVRASPAENPRGLRAGRGLGVCSVHAGRGRVRARVLLFRLPVRDTDGHFKADLPHARKLAAAERRGPRQILQKKFRGSQILPRNPACTVGFPRAVRGGRRVRIRRALRIRGALFPLRENHGGCRAPRREPRRRRGRKAARKPRRILRSPGRGRPVGSARVVRHSRRNSRRDMGRERAARANLLQLRVPRRRPARAVLQIFDFQTLGGQVVVRILRAVRERLQGPMHRRQGEVARLFALRIVL